MALPLAHPLCGFGGVLFLRDAIFFCCLVFQNHTKNIFAIQVAPNGRQRNDNSDISKGASTENFTSGSVRVVPKVKLTHSHSEDGSLHMKARPNGNTETKRNCASTVGPQEIGSAGKLSEMLLATATNAHQDKGPSKAISVPQKHIGIQIPTVS